MRETSGRNPNQFHQRRKMGTHMNALRIHRTRTGLVALAAVLALSLAPAVRAATITATDYDTLNKGSQVGGAVSSDFTSNTGADLGDMVGRVYNNNGTYTYALTVTPGINNISEVNTGFAPAGFNGVAGYSFSNATAAGSGGSGSSAFVVETDSDGTIDWNAAWTNNGSRGFDAGEAITFFYQSTRAPGALDVYNLINHRAGGTDNVAPGGGAPPIPAPAAFPAGLMLLGALAAARRRQWRIA